MTMTTLSCVVSTAAQRQLVKDIMHELSQGLTAPVHEARQHLDQMSDLERDRYMVTCQGVARFVGLSGDRLLAEISGGWNVERYAALTVSDGVMLAPEIGLLLLRVDEASVDGDEVDPAYGVISVDQLAHGIAIHTDWDRDAAMTLATRRVVMPLFDLVIKLRTQA